MCYYICVRISVTVQKRKELFIISSVYITATLIQFNPLSSLLQVDEKAQVWGS